MLSLLAAIGFDPEIRGILVVGTGVVVLFGSLWMILATNQGVRLAALIALAGFFGWMAIMGGFWWIRGIGYVGESVSWHVLDFNRADISDSSVEPVRDLPDPVMFTGLGAEVVQIGLAEGGETAELVGEFATEVSRDDPDFADLSDAEFDDAFERNELRNATTTLSQVMSVAPELVERVEADGQIPDLNGWIVMTTGEAGEAQSTASGAILEHEAFEFDAATEFRFLEAFRTGGKPRMVDINRNNDPDCTFCVDNLERGWLWVRNSARITNPPEYAIIQLQALEESALVIEEGQAPRFPTVDEESPIVSVVMVRELGNLRFPPAMVTLGSLLIFTALAYMLHERDKATMARREAFEAEG